MHQRVRNAIHPSSAAESARVLRVAIILQFAIGGAFLPFLSLHFQDQGLDFREIGWIYTICSVISATVPLLWGIIADRFLSVDRLLFALHAAGALAIVWLAQVDSFQGLLCAYGLWSATSWPSSSLFNAYCYQRLQSPSRQYASLRLWGSVGWMLPSLPVWIWLATHPGKDVHFVLKIAAGIEAAFLLLWPFLPAGYCPGARSTGPSPEPADAHGPAAEGLGVFRQAFLELLRQPGFLILLAIAFLMYLAHAVNFFYSPLYLEQSGVSRQWMGPVQSLGVAAEVGLFFLLPRFLRRFNYIGTLAIGCSAMLARQLFLALTHNPGLLIASSLLSGCSVVFYLTPISLAINEIAGKRVRATAQTLLLIAGPGCGNMAGHLISGNLAYYSGLGLQAVFLAAAVSVALSICLLPFGLVQFAGRDRLGEETDRAA